MRLLHTADLHLGKKLFEQSLLEDQKYILNEIYRIAMEEKADAVILAGDIYDRQVPPAEAVRLFDDFLTLLVKEGIRVIAISGNHDSPERVAFADRILENQGVFLAGSDGEEIKDIQLEDAYGVVHFVLLSYRKPSLVGASGNAEALRTILEKIPIRSDERFCLVTHYFVAGEDGQNPELSDSEFTTEVGGLDRVPVDLFREFSYVALGHIHKPQRMGSGNVYYAGSPLKYSFSEAGYEKSVLIIDLGKQEEETAVRQVFLRPLHDLRCLKGKLEDLISPETVELNRHGNGVNCGLEDYLQVTLTDKEELIDPIGTLRSVYPNVLQIVLEKNRMTAEYEYCGAPENRKRGIEDLFGEFYRLLRGEDMDEKRTVIVKEVAEACDEA